MPIALPDLPRALKEHGVTVQPTTLWRRVITGAIPAFRVRSRWYIQAEDLATIADALRK